VAVVAPLEEEILFAIGRSRTPAAVTAIARLLATGDARLRAHACLAAASSGGRALLQPLVHALLDDDGFVRLCAGEALRHMTGKDVAGDWLYGALAERGAAAEQWFRIVAGESR
jgi:HEAT repeat protein